MLTLDDKKYIIEDIISRKPPKKEEEKKIVQDINKALETIANSKTQNSVDNFEVFKSIYGSEKIFDLPDEKKTILIKNMPRDLGTIKKLLGNKRLIEDEQSHLMPLINCKILQYEIKDKKELYPIFGKVTNMDVTKEIGKQALSMLDNYNDKYRFVPLLVIHNQFPDIFENTINSLLTTRDESKKIKNMSLLYEFSVDIGYTPFNTRNHNELKKCTSDNFDFTILSDSINETIQKLENSLELNEKVENIVNYEERYYNPINKKVEQYCGANVPSDTIDIHDDVSISTTRSIRSGIDKMATIGMTMADNAFTGGAGILPMFHDYTTKPLVDNITQNLNRGNVTVTFNSNQDLQDEDPKVHMPLQSDKIQDLIHGLSTEDINNLSLNNLKGLFNKCISITEAIDDYEQDNQINNSNFLNPLRNLVKIIPDDKFSFDVLLDDNNTNNYLRTIVKALEVRRGDIAVDLIVDFIPRVIENNPNILADNPEFKNEISNITKYAIALNKTQSLSSNNNPLHKILELVFNGTIPEIKFDNPNQEPIVPVSENLLDIIDVSLEKVTENDPENIRILVEQAVRTDHNHFLKGNEIFDGCDKKILSILISQASMQNTFSPWNPIIADFVSMYSAEHFSQNGGGFSDDVKNTDNYNANFDVPNKLIKLATMQQKYKETKKQQYGGDTILELLIEKPSPPDTRYFWERLYFKPKEKNFIDVWIENSGNTRGMIKTFDTYNGKQFKPSFGNRDTDKHTTLKNKTYFASNLSLSL